MYYLVTTLKVFLIILSAFTLLEITESLEYLSGVIYFYTDSSSGSFLFFPLGATILAYYLYGYRALLGVLLIRVLANIFYNTPDNIFLGFTIVDWLGPLIAMIVLRWLTLGFTGKALDTNLGHLILLIITSSLFNSLFKYVLFYLHNYPTEPGFFIATYLAGDIIGGFIFFFGYLWLRSTWLKRN